jgi:hypothetical protein
MIKAHKPRSKRKVLKPVRDWRNEADWTDSERARRTQMLAGQAVVATARASVDASLTAVPTRGVVYVEDAERLQAITDEAYREQLLQVKAAAIEAHRAHLALLWQGRGK